MKKVIIVLLLIAVICIPAFAKIANLTAFRFAHAGGGVSANLSYDKGVKFEGVGLYIEAGIPVNLKALLKTQIAVGAISRVGINYSFSNNPAKNGIFTQLAAYVQPYITNKLSFGYAKAGFEADFHKINGEIKTNVNIIAGGVFYQNMVIYAYASSKLEGNSLSPVLLQTLPFIPNQTATVKFNILNNTSAPLFSFETGCSFELSNSLFLMI